MMQRIWIQLTADKRRFGALVVVAAFGLLFWARIIIISEPPRKAIAGDDPVTEIADRATSSGGLSSGNAHSPPIEIVMLDLLERDPFRISPKHFPKPTPETDDPEEVVQLDTEAVDDQERVRTLRTSFLKGIAGRLTLEAALKGSLAVINGRTVMLGGEFTAGTNGEVTFTLVEIEERTVVIETEGRRFQLQMGNGNH